jgi:hypothetical protein
LENLKGRNHLGELGVDRRIMLKLILKKYDMRVWTEFNWLRVGSSGRLL